MKRLAIVILLLVLAVLAAGTAVVLDLLAYAAVPAKEAAEAEVVAVSPGEPFSTVAGRLFDRELIVMPQKFRRYARLRGFDKQVKAGEYELSAAMAPRKILSTLVEGKVRLRRLTIPEGYDLVQIAAAAAAAGLGSEEEFLAKAYDEALARKMGIEAKDFEGYLFPETYYFPRNISPEQMIAAMVERFRSVFSPQWRRRAEQIGLSVHEIVTLASIIEKETGAAEERPLIASVFHNRLAKGMRLESDPTVIYGIESFDGNLTRKHLRTHTAYNTYRIRGMPPGPIASPGRASLEAALFPAESPYLYFVSKKDGTHHFSATFREHRGAVRKYQLGR
ncbi:MAG: endolytic transglycosylase MltG [Desulfobacterales bacterium]|nr:endolytic transglycosylase MltG [Desulfobacterales bacterium]